MDYAQQIRGSTGIEGQSSHGPPHPILIRVDWGSNLPPSTLATNRYLRKTLVGDWSRPAISAFRQASDPLLCKPAPLQTPPSLQTPFFSLWSFRVDKSTSEPQDNFETLNNKNLEPSSHRSPQGTSYPESLLLPGAQGWMGGLGQGTSHGLLLYCQRDG